MGDPAGVGPEIICMALSRAEVFESAKPLVIGDTGVLEKAAAVTGANLKWAAVERADPGEFDPATIPVINLSSLDVKVHNWGRPGSETGRAMMSYIERAIDMAMSGEISALTTCPINKAAMKMAGGEYSGHTELLARRTGATTYAMMMAGKRLRVVLVTIHVALRTVADAIDPGRITEMIRLTDRALKARFGIGAPEIAVAGLNPHAGEEEMFGDEETRLIRPAIDRALSEGISASGPHPPDTVFYHAAAGKYDAVVCMYHDQGLIPFKMIHFRDGVNTTLGLPIIRTSVDHGTAYDIAGKGSADPQSLIAAVEMAAEHAGRAGL
ncbi:MAG: 4-hydroxythreonine-4-phosphate dehydrogenase PdxA [Desulfobacterales bacterium]|nr:4-hydroxythreonine-4-phosphate dehydrogenase PdxA [Desulfobacterales bacterium]